ncbi:MAG: hypothetical protein WCO80_14910 [Betaproteobacteria bacterium]|jgi:hypothetical protein|nr:hypothetical protein [Betaproteobacteria bacterium]NBT69519.1 hypothetical protein [Betaproteobacteria bacterium]
MKFSETWYVIEKNKRLEVVSQTIYESLEPESFVMIQLFDSKREATSEVMRLIREQSKEALEKIIELEKNKPHSIK